MPLIYRTKGTHVLVCHNQGYLQCTLTLMTRLVGGAMLLVASHSYRPPQ